MKKTVLVSLAMILLVTSAGFYFSERDSLPNLSQIKGERGSVDTERRLTFKHKLNDIIEALENGESDADLLNGTIEELIHTGPLIGRGQVDNSSLSKGGIIFWTNQNRADQGIPNLLSSTTLDEIALERMADMFEKQYFDHVSPGGSEASQVAEEKGYQYIAIGENIALGNFPDDAALVEAWMDSPGHRENILSQNFTEIGVAVERGVFEGDEVWISVQIFGRPLADCPQPDSLLSANIEDNKQAIEDLDLEIKNIQSDIDESELGSKDRAELVDRYNSLVNQINPLILKTKGLIENFNAQVSAFNSCINN